MSRRHAWLRFTTGGPPLPHSLRSLPDAGAREWQRRLTTLQGRWYDVEAPAQVAAVFVLQWLLQVPAHSAAHATAAGPWRVDLTSGNAAKLRGDLAVWIGHAERTGGRRSTARAASKASGRKADLGSVRAWARDNGHKVSDRGRISAEVQAAYDKAHG